MTSTTLVPRGTLHGLRAPTLALLAAFLLLPFAAAQGPVATRTVAVSATGTAYGEPDEASFDAGVSAVNADVAEAATQVNTRVAALTEALLAAGVEEKDIRTSSFSIYPEQLYDTNGQPTTLRYHVDNSLHVTVRDIARLGELLGEAVAAGANNVSSVSYTIADTGALERQARQQAVITLREKAQQLATFSGAELGDVLRLSEGVQAGSPEPLPQFRMEAMAADSGAGNVPVSSGQLAVTVSVKATFTIK